MTTSSSNSANTNRPVPSRTKILPWIILIATSVSCFFVVQKSCVESSLIDDPTGAGIKAHESAYPSQGVHDLEVALDKAKTKDTEFVLDGITFVQGSGLVDVTSMPALEQLLDLMIKHPSMHIRLEGYCVQQEDTRANLRVSHLRSTAVANFLKAKGIDESRLRTVGRGESRRRTPGASTQSEAYNVLIGLFVERI